jgi:hypothetical protein
MSEHLMTRGQLGYEAILIDEEKMQEAQEIFEGVRNEKGAVRAENLSLNREIGALIEKIVGAQQDLQESLKELATFGDDSPYIPSQTVSHFQQPQNGHNPEDTRIKKALEHLESRIAEMEDHQNTTNLISGVRMESFDNSSASFEFDLAQLASAHCEGPLLEQFILLYNQGSSESSSIATLTLGWTPECVMTEASLSVGPKFEDIMEMGILDNSPSFIIREVSHRIITLSKRFASIYPSIQSESIQLDSPSLFGTNLSFSFPELDMVTLRVMMPWEHPHMPIRLLGTFDKTGAAVEVCSKLNKSKFENLDDARAAVLSELKKTM